MFPYPASWVDATPAKGVIVVEYYWERGTRNSYASFKRIRAADKCWCGSKRNFARCHRRDDDWSYVALDPDQRAYSPVVLIERKYSCPDEQQVRARLEVTDAVLRLDLKD